MLSGGPEAAPFEIPHPKAYLYLGARIIQPLLQGRRAGSAAEEIIEGILLQRGNAAHAAAIKMKAAASRVGATREAREVIFKENVISVLDGVTATLDLTQIQLDRMDAQEAALRTRVGCSPTTWSFSRRWQRSRRRFLRELAAGDAHTRWASWLVGRLQESTTWATPR